MKQCTICKLYKPLIDFHKHNTALDGLHPYCKDCNKAKSRKWFKENKTRRQKYDEERFDVRKNNRLKKVYGISLQEYNSFLEAQNNSCAICKQKCKTGKHLAVDHCHKTGGVRGLLCGNCNKGLGLLNDDVHLLKEAVSYLESFNPVEDE